MEGDIKSLVWLVIFAIAWIVKVIIDRKEQSKPAPRRRSRTVGEDEAESAEAESASPAT